MKVKWTNVYRGDFSAVMLVAVASAEGIPTLNPEE